MMRSILAAALVALAACSPPAEKTPTHGVIAGDLVVDNPRIRPPLGGTTTAAGYMTIHNRGNAPDRLLSATTAAAVSVELHTHRMEADVARMEQVQSIEAPAHGEVAFAPGGLHLMLFGFQSTATKVPVTLRFEKAGEVVVPFEIMGGGANAAVSDEGHAGH